MKYKRKKYVLCPTSNTVYPYGINQLIKNPSLADAVINSKDKDQRFKDRNYEMYTSRFFFDRVVYYKKRGFPLVIKENGKRALIKRKTYNFLYCKLPGLVRFYNLNKIRK